MADYTYYICDRDGNLKHEVQADIHTYQDTVLELHNLEYNSIMEQNLTRLVMSYKEWGSFWRERNDES